MPTLKRNFPECCYSFNTARLRMQEKSAIWSCMRGLISDLCRPVPCLELWCERFPFRRRPGCDIMLRGLDVGPLLDLKKYGPAFERCHRMPGLSRDLDGHDRASRLEHGAPGHGSVVIKHDENRAPAEKHEDFEGVG